MFKVTSSREVVPRVESGEIVKQGYLRKLKKMRKRYFVLRGDSHEAPARLEYYESEKKWKTTTCNPKRSIVLKNCFNINKRTDTRHKYVIALYTRNDKFCIVLDSEGEMESWLQALLTLQRGEAEEGGPIRPNFEHVWEVYMHSKELGSRTDMVGRCRLCLTDQSVTLVKLERNESAAEKSLEYSLQKIRRCGYVTTFLFIEVGQCTVTGAGNLWLQAEDTNIAANIHQTIMKYLEKPNTNQTNNANKDIKPKSRDRSVSVNESSRPTSMQKWPTHPGLMTRERADSMPSRARTTSECASHFPHPPRLHNNPLGRPHSTSYNRGISYSPPGASSPVSPGSAACSTDSAGSSLSMDSDVIDAHWEDRYSHSLTPDEPVIVEENSDDYAPWIGEDEQLNNYVRNSDTSTYSQLPNSISCHNSANNLQTTNHDFKKCNYASQVSRLEISSPGGKSKDGSYVIMGPGDKSHKPTNNHSRGSSLTEEGYVPMAPGNSDDGYVDMDHGSSRRKGHYQSGELSTGSSCSITSGTPSTDQRFSEYPLDKVSSYFNADEEIVPAERPARAYSLGSRPTFNKNRTETPIAMINERTRAFSVGSKNAKGFNSLKMHNHHHHQHMSSHSSMEPSDDMMELDFTKKGRMKNRKKPSSSERLSVPGGSASTLSSAASSYSTAEGSYMDMSPRCSPSLAPSPPKTNRFLVMLSKSPPKYDFLSFARNSPPVSGYPSPSLGRVPEVDPICNECGQLTPLQDTDSYIEMKPDPLGMGQKIIAAKTAKARIESFPSTVSSAPRRCSREETTLKRKMSHTSTIPEDNNNTKIIIGSSPSNPVDEYVEMDLGSVQKISARSRKNTNGDEDYMEMDGRGDKVEPGRSQPIAILPNAKETSHNSSYALGVRKNSTGTSPKPSFLQFGSSPSPISSPYATLGRNRPRKNTARRDSRDNLGSGSSGSSNSIFPLSLNSSINSPEDFESKCLVDATSGTVMLSTETSRSVDDLSSRVECTVLENDSDDYVMYEPGSLRPNISDYAHMAPVKPSGTPVIRKTSAPLLKLRPFERILQGLGVSSGSMTSSSSSPSIKAIAEPAPELKESSSLPEEEEEDEETTPAVKLDDDSTPKAPTVSKGKELHYASLDLARSGSESEESNKTLQTQTSLTESSSPSPNPTDGSSFAYAEIDFARSSSSQN